MTIDGLFQITGLTLCAAAFAWLSLGLAHGALAWTNSRRLLRLRQEQLRKELAVIERRTVAAAVPLWNGWRKFRVRWKVREARDCHSLYLVPHDEQKLPLFHPGQYLTLQLHIPGQVSPVIRCYSLSDRPGQEHYRITIKKTRSHANGDEPGRASSFLNDQLKAGDIVDVAAPRGRFCLDVAYAQPIVLIAAGIGITPILSMLQTLAWEESPQEIQFFYGVRDGQNHLFRESIEALADKLPNLQTTIYYSQPRPADIQGDDYHAAGRITVADLRRRLPSSNYEFYLCGPTLMLQETIEGLRGWSVPDQAIHVETFGTLPLETPPGVPAACRVRFERSGLEAEWTSDVGSLLDFADAQGVVIPTGCRAGHCGTCEIAVRAGRVRHSTAPGITVNQGSCLPCIARPLGSVTLDA